MTIKTLHGPINFQLQRFRNSKPCAKKEETYFSLTGQFQEVYMTPRLQELSGYYSTILSYKEVENLASCKFFRDRLRIRS